MSYNPISHTNFSLIASQTQSYSSSEFYYSTELMQAVSLLEESLVLSLARDTYTKWIASSVLESDLTDSEKIDLLGLLLFFSETQPEYTEQIFNDSSLTPFEKIKKDWLSSWQKWGELHKSCLPKETQKNIPSIRFVCLLRDLSKLVFSNTGKINKGGISIAKALFNSELGCCLSSEHRTQILKILKILSEDYAFQTLLEKKRLPHPKMKTLIQTSLKVDPMHPIGHVEMVRTLLGLLFLDHRQFERQNSCYCFGAFIFLLNDHPLWVAEKALTILESGKVTFRNPNVLWVSNNEIYYHKMSSIPFDACDLWLLHPGRTQGLNCEIPTEKMHQFPTFILGLQPIYQSIHLPLPRKPIKATLGNMYRQVAQTLFSQMQEKNFRAQCIASAERTVTSLERDPLYQLFTILMRFSFFNFVTESKIKKFLSSLGSDFIQSFLLKIRDTDQKTFRVGLTFIQHFNNILKNELWLLDVDASPLELTKDAVILKQEDNIRKYEGDQELLSVLFKLLSSPLKLIHFDTDSNRLYFVESFDQLQKILYSIGNNAMNNVEKCDSLIEINTHWRDYLLSLDCKKQLHKFFASWNKEEIGLSGATVELFEVLDAPYLYHSGGVTSTLLNHLGFFFHTSEFTFSGVEEFLINLRRMPLEMLSPKEMQSYLNQERALLGILSNNTTGHTFTYYPYRFRELWLFSNNLFPVLNKIFYLRGIKVLQKKLTVEERQKFLDSIYEKNGFFRPFTSSSLLTDSNAGASVFFRNVKQQIQSFQTLHPTLLEVAEEHFQTLLQKISCESFMCHLTDLLFKLIPNELNADVYSKIADEIEHSFAQYPEMDPLILSYRMQKILSETTKRFYDPYEIEKMICNQMDLPLTLDLADLNWRSGARERPDHQKAVLKYHYPTASLVFYIRKGKKEELMKNQLFNIYNKATFFLETSQPLHNYHMFPVTKKA